MEKTCLDMAGFFHAGFAQPAFFAESEAAFLQEKNPCVIADST
jgi:hypothetical protein